LKFLQLFSPTDIALLNKHRFVDKFKDAFYQSSKKFEEVMSALRYRDAMKVLLNELVTASNNAYEFRSSKAKELIAQYVEAQEELTAQQNQDKSAYHVRVYEERGEQVAAVTRFNHFNKNSDGVADTTNIVRLNDLPEDIMGKLAVLSMLESRSYVEGVGMRMSDATYWVTRDDAV